MTRKAVKTTRGELVRDGSAADVAQALLPLLCAGCARPIPPGGCFTLAGPGKPTCGACRPFTIQGGP